MLKRVTIIDIANRVGLSKSTVAYAFSSRDSGKVSSKNLVRIQAAAEALGYRANRAAKVLRSGRSRTVGILFPAPYSPFYAALLSSLQKVIYASGYMGSFAFWEDCEGQKKATEMVLSQQLEGIITVEPGVLPGDLPFPVVTYYNADARFDGVIHDFSHALNSVFGYLVELGHRRIGHISREPGTARTRCFMENIRSRGFLLQPEWLYTHSLGGDNFALGYQGMQAILRSRPLPTALFAHDDQIALGALRAALEAGLRVPEDLSIIGYDDIPGASYSTPSLTTFGLGEDVSCADLLWKSLLHRISNPAAPRKEYLLKPVLMKRESCSFARKEEKIQS